jgi:hypothetical protein
VSSLYQFLNDPFVWFALLVDSVLNPILGMVVQVLAFLIDWVLSILVMAGGNNVLESANIATNTISDVYAVGRYFGDILIDMNIVEGALYTGFVMYAWMSLIRVVVWAYHQVPVIGGSN